MEKLIDHYPVFEANQVLMSTHLNDAFNYLDQQERQTRSHLIGIGIVCGLEVRLSGATVTLSKGCGVTSEGYLIVEPEDATLTTCRPYYLPPAIEYLPFKKSDGSPYAMWELCGDGVPGTTPLGSPADFLNDKAVLLFMELKQAALRNCSPSNCDDKGSQVTATVRRLLIAKSDLDSIVAAAEGLQSGLTEQDLSDALSGRLNLPDLRLHRFGVPDTDPDLVTSNDVYRAFLEMIRTDGLAQATGAALSQAYAAFRPLLVADYQADPFAGFNSTYAFLDSAPTDATQVRFLQYYADLFCDLLRAYDEFRWAGMDLICACCPDDGLFPRHLMLGLLNPAAALQTGIYRNDFLRSPATGCCSEKTTEVRQLFARLVAMHEGFTNQPTLPQSDASQPVDPQIRITPSRHCCGRHALENEAIPYYYAPTGAPPTYKVWSPTLTRRQRANQNLGYNADLYAPAAPDFVTDALGYDLGSRDFLRIEGHLGKDYRSVLDSLLTMKSQYRLPIDVIALRTGAYDDSQPVDPAQEGARFQDLGVLYDALRGELRSHLAEGIMQLYDQPIAVIKGLTLNAGTPNLPLLQQYAPHYTYAANTVGAWYEQYLAHFENQGYIDVDQNAINANTVGYLYCVLFTKTQPPEPAAHAYVVAIYYLNKLAENPAAALASLDFADFENKYQDLMALIRYLRTDPARQLPSDLKGFLPQDEFIDLCESVLMGCQLDAFRAIHDQFQTRVGELRRLQFLSSFLQQEPGIQHKGGVPLGGTFILVYHGVSAPPVWTGGLDINAVSGMQPVLERYASEEISAAARYTVAPSPPRTTGVPPAGSSSTSAVAEKPQARSVADISAPIDSVRLLDAVGKLKADPAMSQSEDVREVLNWLTLYGPAVSANAGGAPDPAAGIIAKTVDALDAGTVIADFFLPYRLAGNATGIAFVLPAAAPTFTVTTGCTNANGDAAVAITAKGGVPPYDVAVDGGAYQALAGPLQLSAGQHSLKLRDTAGSETATTTLSVAPMLAIGAPTYTCAEGQYTATATISGGVPPYQLNGKALPAATLVSDPAPSGTPLSVKVTDSRGCAVTARFEHECCTLPCGGESLSRNYRFFIPEPGPDQDDTYLAVQVKVSKFLVQAKAGKSVDNSVDLSGQVAQVLGVTAQQLSAKNFETTVKQWLTSINAIVAKTPELAQPGKASWLTLGYQHAVVPARWGVLTIEYFKCLKFEIQLDVTLTLPSDTRVVMMKPPPMTRSLRLIYSPSGTSVQVDDARVTIPAFDGFSIDKCSERPQPVNLCPVPPQFSVRIEGEAAVTAGQKVTFGAVASASSGLRFAWEAIGGTPVVGSGAKFSTMFASPGTAVLTLTAVNAKGCAATATMLLKVEGESVSSSSTTAGNTKQRSSVTKRVSKNPKGGKTKPGGSTRRGGK